MPFRLQSVPAGQMSANYLPLHNAFKTSAMLPTQNCENKGDTHFVKSDENPIKNELKKSNKENSWEIRLNWQL